MDERKRSSQILKISFNSLSLLLKVVMVGLFVVIFIGGWAYSQFPSDKKIKGCLVTQMYKVNLCPTSGNYVRLSQISPYLQKSIVLTEDSSFWDHNGFDFQELENSFKKNLEAGRFARGGSTITQQLSKNMFLSKDKTLTRKVVEALITVRMEKILSKREILEKYLNVVQFGKNVFGVKNAAQFYFKKAPSQLSIVESAFLTLLLPNPEIYAKSFHTKNLTPFAHKRLNQIIDRLYQYHRINENEFIAAKSDLEYFLSKKPPEILESPDEENFEEVSLPPNVAVPGFPDKKPEEPAFEEPVIESGSDIEIEANPIEDQPSDSEKLPE